MSSDEPQFHTGIEDGLPNEHPRANHQIHCERCDQLVHAFNNELMTDWVEWRLRALCWPCFASQFPGDLIDIGPLNNAFLIADTDVDDGKYIARVSERD